jgi:hypothetical protein
MINSTQKTRTGASRFPVFFVLTLLILGMHTGVISTQGARGMSVTITLDDTLAAQLQAQTEARNLSVEAAGPADPE